MRKPYQMMIIPLTLWSGFEQAFIGADFTAVSRHFRPLSNSWSPQKFQNDSYI